MSTHLYTRKTYFGGWADATQGDPTLAASIKAAFPGYKFVVRSFGSSTHITFEEELTPAEVVTLDGIYTAWDPESTPPPDSLPLTVSVSTDVTTTSKSFVDLLTTSFAVKNGGSVTIYGEVSGSCSVKTGSLEFQVLVDNTPVKGFTVYANGVGGATHYVDVGSETHTVTLQWRVTTGLGRVRAQSNSLEHAFLRIS